jgi:hypothetical protein
VTDDTSREESIDRHQRGLGDRRSDQDETGDPIRAELSNPRSDRSAQRVSDKQNPRPAELVDHPLRIGLDPDHAKRI